MLIMETKMLLIFIYLLHLKHVELQEVRSFKQKRGSVEILLPYRPFYIQVGEPFNLTCKGTGRLTLVWKRKVPADSWEENIINVTKEKRFITQTCIEEPKGDVTSVLFNSAIQSSDRGLYTCSADADLIRFSVWIQALSVLTDDIEATEREPLILQCTLTGLLNNMPAFEFLWGKDGINIPFAEEDRYHIRQTSEPNAHISLTIENPYKEDLGEYRCYFILYTNVDPVHMEGVIQVTGDLPSSANSKKMYSISILSIFSFLSFHYFAQLVT